MSRNPAALNSTKADINASAESVMSRTITLAAPAKVNLILRVLRKRQDGYHDISSLMQPISLHDEIIIKTEHGSGITLSCSNPAVPSDSANLAFQAAELFLNATGLSCRIDLDITKNIPAGAGLGGGSSDAATVLCGLNTLLSAGLGADELMRLGARLGSDVPFFVLGTPAIATGRGEILEGVTLPRFWYVLVNPGFEISTVWAYKNLDLTKTRQDYILSYSCEVFENLDNLAQIMVNDLEAAVFSRYPDICAIKEAILAVGARAALMSGSGSTVFGLFREREAAVKAADRLRDEFDGSHLVYVAEGQ